MPVDALKTATRRYADWLLQKKKIFNRRRSLRQQDLEGETRDLFRTSEAGNLLGNEKLAVFLRSVALERQVFDYLALTMRSPTRLPEPRLPKAGHGAGA